MLRVKYLFLCLIGMLFVCPPNTLFSQEKVLSVINVDTKKFPKIRAYYDASIKEIDQQSGKETFKQRDDLTASDFSLIDSIPGKGDIVMPGTAFTQRCSTLKDAPAVRVILVIDNSFSMADPAGKSGKTRMEVVKNGAKAFVNTVDYIEPTAVSVVSFATEAKLRQTFTDDIPSLEAAINVIEPAGNTNYDDAFLSKDAGIISLFRNDSRYEPPSVRRVVIFLTDGEPSMGDLVDPNKKSNFIKRMSDSLAKYNITMFTITAFIKMNPDLRNWSSQTGGRTYEVLSDNPEQEMEDIYRQIASLLSKEKICWLEWTSSFGCSEESRYRTVKISIPKDALMAKRKYTAPETSVASVRVSHMGITFGNPPPNGTAQKSVKLTAVNSDVTLTSPVFASTNCGSYRIVSPTPPILIKKDESVDVVIEFKQGNAQVYCPSTLSFSADPCPPPQLALFGGVNSVKLINPSPTTSSILSSCEDITITYDGVTPISKPIQIDYSSDEGKTWNTLTTSAKDGEYLWKTADLKNLPKDGKFKLRLIEGATNTHLWAKSAGGSSSDSAFTIQIGANDDDLFIAGIFKNLMQFGGNVPPLANPTSNDFGGYVAKFSAISGNPTWATKFTSTKEIKVKAATCNDKNGAEQRIYATGFFTGVAKFESLEKQSNDINKLSMFLAILNDAGVIINAIHLGSTANATGEMYATNVAFDPVARRVFVRGFARGKISYTSLTKGNLIHDAGSDTKWSEFMAEFNEQGSLLDIINGVRASVKTWAKSSVQDKNQNTYETGTFAGKRSFEGVNDLISIGSTDIFVSKKGEIKGSKSESEVPFEISVARLATVNNVTSFNLCNVPVGDTELCQITSARGLGNFGNIETTITKLELSNPTEFVLLTPLEGRKFSANSPTELLEFLCMPNAQNQRCTDVTVYGECSEPFKFTVCANGLPPCTNEFVKEENFSQTIINQKDQKEFKKVYVNQTAVIRKMKVYLTGEGANTVFKLVDANNGNTPNSNNEIILSLKPNEQIDITVSYTPTKEGLSCVNLNYETTNFTCDIPFTKLCGEAIAPVDASVDNATWICQKPGTTAPQKVAFKNTGNLPIVIKDITTSNPVFEVKGQKNSINVGVGDTHLIDVEFTPTTATSYSSDLTVTFADDNNATQDVQRSSVLRGDGCEPKVSLTKECFGSIIIGQNTTKQNAVTVTNTGNYKLVVSNVTIAPNNEFDVTGPKIFELAPDSSKVIGLSFAPKGTGNRTAIVTVVSDAPEATKDIEVCGVGVPAGNAIDFKDVFYCDKKDSVYTFPATPAAQGIVVTASITGTGDETSFSITPSSQTVKAGETPKWTITCEPKRGGNSLNATLSFSIEGVGTTDFQLMANPKTANISVSMDPNSLEGFVIGGTQRFTVKMASDFTLEKLDLDTITAEISYNPTMFYYKEGSFVSYTLGEIIWDTPKEVKGGILRVKSKEIPKLPKDLQRDLFSVELVSVLGNAYSDTVKSKVFFGEQYSTCLNVKNVASVDFTTETVCGDDKRIIAQGLTIDAPVISPNPSSTSAKIDFTVGIESSTMLYVVNQMGERVMTLIDEKLKQGSYSTVLDLSNISSGAYHIVYKCGPYSFTQPMTIAK